MKNLMFRAISEVGRISRNITKNPHFNPKSRDGHGYPCMVCGRYSDLAELHKIVILYDEQEQHAQFGMTPLCVFCLQLLTFESVMEYCADQWRLWGKKMGDFPIQEIAKSVRRLRAETGGTV